MELRPVWNEIHAGGQTDGDDRTNSAFVIFPTHLQKILRPVRVQGTVVYSLVTKLCQIYSQKKTLIVSP